MCLLVQIQVQMEDLLALFNELSSDILSSDHYTSQALHMLRCSQLLYKNETYVNKLISRS